MEVGPPARQPAPGVGDEIARDRHDT
jgi:hypothetical protein